MVLLLHLTLASYSFDADDAATAVTPVERASDDSVRSLAAADARELAPDARAWGPLRLGVDGHRAALP